MSSQTGRETAHAIFLTSPEFRATSGVRRLFSECPMPLSFASCAKGGADPWSARDALVPPPHRRIRCLPSRKGRPGVGRGRGRPPHYLRRCPEVGKLSGIGQEAQRHVVSTPAAPPLRVCWPTRSAVRRQLHRSGSPHTLPPPVRV